MSFDTALNLIWLGIGVFALSALAILEVRRYRASAPGSRFQRLLASLVIILTLFPAVSSSDDL